MTDSPTIENLQEVLRHTTARFNEAVAYITNKPFKVYQINSNNNPRPRVFEIPMLPFKWVESFEGLHTMMIDDNLNRTICCCRSVGSVRLPPFSHRRNERIIVIEGRIIDHNLGIAYDKQSIVDFPRHAVRDLEFIDCVFSIILTPPLDYKQNE